MQVEVEMLGVLRHAGEIVGAVVRGRAVPAQAAVAHVLLRVRIVRRALEHQVLEQVRHAGLAVVLHARADLHGQVHGRRRLRVVGQRQHVQAVGQRVFGDAFDAGDARHAGGEPRLRGCCSGARSAAAGAAGAAGVCACTASAPAVSAHAQIQAVTMRARRPGDAACLMVSPGETLQALACSQACEFGGRMGDVRAARARRTPSGSCAPKLTATLAQPALAASCRSCVVSPIISVRSGVGAELVASARAASAGRACRRSRRPCGSRRTGRAASSWRSASSRPRRVLPVATASQWLRAFSACSMASVPSNSTMLVLAGEVVVAVAVGRARGSARAAGRARHVRSASARPRPIT